MQGECYILCILPGTQKDINDLVRLLSRAFKSPVVHTSHLQFGLLQLSTDETF
jgi:hypothetical protein